MPCNDNKHKTFRIIVFLTGNKPPVSHAVFSCQFCPQGVESYAAIKMEPVPGRLLHQPIGYWIWFLLVSSLTGLIDRNLNDDA